MKLLYIKNTIVLFKSCCGTMCKPVFSSLVCLTFSFHLPLKLDHVLLYVLYVIAVEDVTVQKRHKGSLKVEMKKEGIKKDLLPEIKSFS